MSENPGLNRPIWQAENTHPELADQLLVGLREVTDPELGLNIIQLGLVRNVEIDENEAKIYMILTTPYCPYGPAMLENTRKKAEKILDRPTKIEMGLEMWDFSMMEEGLGGDWGLY
jgi:metal-sulfur cluster biosynthetic enzyme